MAQNKEAWGTRVGLILAMAGNAVGLGNFLRFPVQAVNNGGGAFLIPYIVCFLLMGIPLLWIEWTMGRYGGRFNNHSTPFILNNMSRAKFWKYFGVFGIFTNVAVAAYYCYIESWTMAYVYHSVIGTFQGADQNTVAAFFDNYVDIYSSTTGLPFEAIIFFVLCILLNSYILSRGLNKGVEMASRIGMPMLILFGVVLAIKALTIGDSHATADCPDCNAFLGLDFLWTPQFDSLSNPKVWLAAAGQIFFTLSVGMGTIHCYAAYVRSKDDIALNAMSAGWMNTFVEVVLGASIVIPISVGFLGLEKVQEIMGFSMAFKTMPFLFDQWGAVFGVLGGVMWFGLLFFAGVTSSLAMGTPWLSFMEDEFGWSRQKGAWSFGLLVLIMGLPTVLFFQNGVFDEYDYWAGTVSLVVFALAESILFAWIFGINRGWDELMRGADLRPPAFYKPIVKFITPLLLVFVFVGALVTPKGNDWQKAFGGDWQLDDNSIIGQLRHQGVDINRDWFASSYQSDVEGIVTAIRADSAKGGQSTLMLADTARFYTLKSEGAKVFAVKANKPVPEGAVQFDSLVIVKSYPLAAGQTPLVKVGDKVQRGTPVVQGSFVNNVFYKDMARLLLLAVFVGIASLVWIASRRRERRGYIEIDRS